MHICLIYFGHQARLRWMEPLSKPIPDEIWKQHRGETDFDPAIQLAFEQIAKLIDDKDQSLIYFFTDGYADFPVNAMQQVETMWRQDQTQWETKEKRNKCDILLTMDDMTNTVPLMCDKFNEMSKEIFGHPCCQIEPSINVSRFGEVLIDHIEMNEI